MRSERTENFSENNINKYHIPLSAQETHASEKI